MDSKFRKIVIDNREMIVDMWLKEVESLRSENRVADISEEIYEATTMEFVDVIYTSIENKGSTKVVEDFSEKIITLGWPLSYIVDGLQVFRRTTIHVIIKQAKTLDADYAMNAVTSVAHWVEPIIRILVNEYSGNWENIVSLQRIARQELSAPLIPVTEGITIMPLIGTVDTDRAKLIMESLLQGVIKHNSEVVLIDITGVPVVDTMVAHHLIQAAEAVQLIGAKCILVGIRPEIAQTIINLGIDLTNFPTSSSLKKGFKTALEITNRKISELESTESSIEKLIDSLKREG